ncbi:MAG TPA: pitrilysin family protein [Anaerolineales bacterium]
MTEPPAARTSVGSLPGPDDILRRELASGLVVLARENYSSPSVVLAGYLTAHGLDETEARAGLADLTASGLMRGTERRSFQEIYESIESIGAGLGVGGGKVGTSFHGKALAEDLGVLLELLEEVLRRPVFPEGPIAQLRHEKLTALSIRDDDTGARADMAFDEIAYPGHPYRIPNEGRRESVSTLTAADLAAFHRMHYGPRGMVVCIVGAVPAGRAIDQVAEILGGWSSPSGNAAPAVPAATAPTAVLRQVVPIPGKVQADVVLGAPGPSRFEAHFLAAALANSVLGRFGMMGRIGETVREKAGLAYYAYSSLEGGPGPGSWKTVAGVHPGHLEETVDLIRREIGRLVERGVTRAELEDNQAHFIGRLPLQLETNEGVAGALLNLERYQLGLDYYRRYPDLVRAITREAAVEAVRRHLHPDRLAIGIAGPPA